MPKKQETYEDWDFTQLVDYAAGYILKELIAGKFRSSVYAMLDLAVRWRQAQVKKERE